MLEFTAQDHDTLAQTAATVKRLEAGQGRILKRQARLPNAVARRVAAQISRRAAVLIGAGVLIGSALGSASADVVRRLALQLIGGH